MSGIVYSNGVGVATGFKNSNPAPNDDRTIVSTFNDLLFDGNGIPTSALYRWIEIYTDDDGKKWKWNGNDRTLAANWLPAGSDGIIIVEQTLSGGVTIDLSLGSHFKITLSGDLSSVKFANGEEFKKVELNVTKDQAGRQITIAPDFDESSVASGAVRLVRNATSPLGAIAYIANTTTTAGAFNPAEWDLYIKFVDDVEPVLSYALADVDKFIVEPRTVGAVNYYSLTPIYNVG